MTGVISERTVLPLKCEILCGALLSLGLLVNDVNMININKPVYLKNKKNFTRITRLQNYSGFNTNSAPPLSVKCC